MYIIMQNLDMRNLYSFKLDSVVSEEIDDDEDNSEVEEENGVLLLNDANFDNFVEGKDTVLLEFYAPW